jgi:multiple sugar transport system permease protein
MIVLFVIVIVPMVFLWYVSLTNYDLGKGWDQRHFAGLSNFLMLFKGEDRDFWPAVLTTLIFLACTVTLEFIIGLAVAMLFNRTIAGKAVWMAFLIIPLTITPAVIGLMWKLMYNTEYGVLNFLLNFINLKINWLGPRSALLSIIMVDVWQWTPFVALMLYAGLQAISTEPYESAVVDGASSLQIFRFITLPLLRPMIVVAVLLRSIDALRIFDTVYVLTKGGPGNITELLSLHIYRVGFEHTGWIGRSSAVAIVLLIMATIITTIFMRVVNITRPAAIANRIEENTSGFGSAA